MRPPNEQGKLQCRRGTLAKNCPTAGRGGALDRLDSLSFSAPVFFHLVQYFFLSKAGRIWVARRF